SVIVVTGSVLDADHHPLPNVIIELWERPTPVGVAAPTDAWRSDVDGRFRLRSNHAGNFVIRVSGCAAISAEKSIQLPSSGLKGVELVVSDYRRREPAQGQVPWPPGLETGGTYIVHPDEASLAFVPYMFIPDCAAIILAADVESVNWGVGALEFGRNATLDLSAPVLKPLLIVGGKDVGGQPSYGTKGATGGAGSNGGDGPHGRTLKVHVGRIAPRGSLWMRTDGAPGVDGANGGTGQLGGGSSCGANESASDGGDGGDGGPGGNGGNGGATSQVQLSIADPQVSVTAGSCTTLCGTSTRPNMVPDSGIVAVWGSPGCGGNGGKGGAGGSGGPGRKCPFYQDDRKSGAPGRKGADGLPGKAGMCS